MMFERQEVMSGLWSDEICGGDGGRLTSDTVWQLTALYRVGGPAWYVGVLVDMLLRYAGSLSNLVGS